MSLEQTLNDDERLAQLDLDQLRQLVGLVEYDSAEVSFVPATQVELEPDGARRVLRLIDALEDSDDVQNVYANLEVPDEVLAFGAPAKVRGPLTEGAAVWVDGNPSIYQ